MAVTSSSVVGFPLGWDRPAAIEDAASVFVGYLMLDALVSNQDRHHENWGLIVYPEKGVFFAPTFDHASSLGRNETDEVRTERLTTRDRGRSIETYVARAKSAFYATSSSTRPLATLDAFLEAAKFRPEATDYWLGKLASVDMGDYWKILADIPDSEISTPARNFGCRMLEINANRMSRTDNR